MKRCKDIANRKMYLYKCTILFSFLTLMSGVVGCGGETPEDQFDSDVGDDADSPGDAETDADSEAETDADRLPDSDEDAEIDEDSDVDEDSDAGDDSDIDDHDSDVDDDVDEDFECVHECDVIRNECGPEGIDDTHSSQWIERCVEDERGCRVFVIEPCDDDDVCTIDQCTYTYTRDREPYCYYHEYPDCCHHDTDCDDENVCTEDSCFGDGLFCLNLPVEGCCNFRQECTDNDDCTLDTCVDNECVTSPICCEADEDCNNGDGDCSVDRCVEGRCQYTWALDDTECCGPALFSTGFESETAEPFSDDVWAVVSASDGHQVHSGTHSLHYRGTVMWATASFDVDLPDTPSIHMQFWVLGDRWESLRAWTNVEREDGDYRFSIFPIEFNYAPDEWQLVSTDLSFLAGETVEIVITSYGLDVPFKEENEIWIDDFTLTSCEPKSCSSDAHCGSSSEHGPGVCTEGTCQYSVDTRICTGRALEGGPLCETDEHLHGSCTDHNPCTRDFWGVGNCEHEPDLSASLSCCSVDDDCDDRNPCTFDECIDSLCHNSCSDECSYALPYRETFDQFQRLHDSCWTTTDEDGEYWTNWRISQDYIHPPLGDHSGNLGHLEFMGGGWALDLHESDLRHVFDYEHCVMSPTIDCSGFEQVYFSFFVYDETGDVSDLEENELSARVLVDDGEWTSVWTYDIFYSEPWPDIPLRGRESVNVSEFVVGSESVRLAFCMTGEINSIRARPRIDDIRLGDPGEPPVWAEFEEIEMSVDEHLSVTVSGSDPEGEAVSIHYVSGLPDVARGIVDNGDGTATVSLRSYDIPEGRYEVGLILSDGFLEVPANLIVNVADL